MTIRPRARASKRLAERPEDIQACGLPLALEVMGERWSFMILRAAFNGTCHFEDFLRVGIARNILTLRLGKLVDHGIMRRDPCPDDRRKIEYLLTSKGMDLLPAMVALRQWGEKYGLGVPSNPALVDRRDHLPIGPVAIRGHDDRLLTWRELEWLDKSQLAAAPDSSPEGT